MMRLRAFDGRMLVAQRQGKTSFYMQHLGEEAVSCAFRKALQPGDMNFPTYRQAGLLISDGYPMVTMMNGRDSSLTIGVTIALTTPKTAATRTRVTTRSEVSPAGFPTLMPSKIHAAAASAAALTATVTRTRCTFLSCQVGSEVSG